MEKSKTYLLNEWVVYGEEGKRIIIANPEKNRCYSVSIEALPFLDLLQTPRELGTYLLELQNSNPELAGKLTQFLDFLLEESILQATEAQPLPVESWPTFETAPEILEWRSNFIQMESMGVFVKSPTPTVAPGPSPSPPGPSPSPSPVGLVGKLTSSGVA